jgi:hypothetical protein
MNRLDTSFDSELIELTAHLVEMGTRADRIAGSRSEHTISDVTSNYLTKFTERELHYCPESHCLQSANRQVSD